MKTEIMQYEFKENFKKCPICQYEDGFHSMFQREGDQVKWLFICPSCHQVFDVGLTVKL